MLKVQRRACATCVYRKDSPIDPKVLEERVRNARGDFDGYRVCHSSKDACCRGFWNRYKWKFQLGQIAQRLGLVQYVDDKVSTPVSRSVAKSWGQKREKESKV